MGRGNRGRHYRSCRWNRRDVFQHQEHQRTARTFLRDQVGFSVLDCNLDLPRAASRLAQSVPVVHVDSIRYLATPWHHLHQPKATDNQTRGIAEQGAEGDAVNRAP